MPPKSLHRRIRKTRQDSKSQQVSKESPAPSEQDEGQPSAKKSLTGHDPGHPPKPLPRPCRSKDLSTEYFTHLFSPHCIPKLNTNFDLHNALLWSRALQQYRFSLLHSTVAVTLDGYSETTITHVAFRKEGEDDVGQYSFWCDSKPSLMSPIPKYGPMERSEQTELMPEEDRQGHEIIIKSVLDQTLFERTKTWEESKIPDVTAPGALDEVHSLSWHEYANLTKQVLDNDGMSARSKESILRKLLDAGNAAYQTCTVMNIQEAFLRDMKDSAGRKGMATLLEHLCDIVDGDKLHVESHGADYDYEVRVLVNIQDKCLLDPEKDPKVDTANIREGEVDEVHMVNDLDDSRSSESVASHGSSRVSPNSSADQADMTVFVRKGSRAVPLLLIEIKSHNTDDSFTDSVDDLFKTQKLLLGGLLFSDEIFGLHINPVSAKIYRMKKDSSSRKVIYSHQTYGFRKSEDKPGKILFDSDEFLRLCDHLCKILKYGLDKNEVTDV